jgi:hypothetical protein
MEHTILNFVLINTKNPPFAHPGLGINEDGLHMRSCFSGYDGMIYQDDLYSWKLMESWKLSH